VIFVPQTVTVFLDKKVAVDLDKVQIEIPDGGERNRSDSAEDLKELFGNTPAEAPKK
jgi:hypothetical protein